MWLFTVLNHLLNFMLPAFWMATMLSTIHVVLHRRSQRAVSWRRHWLWLFGSGVAVLLAGLMVFQRDGRMMTYVALVMVTGLVHAFLTRRRAAPVSPQDPVTMAAPPKN